MSDDPFQAWENAINVPNEDELRARTHELYNETVGEDGGIRIQIFPSPVARASAAIIAGQFQALLDTKVFTREEAFRIVIESMTSVVVHHGDHDDEDD